MRHRLDGVRSGLRGPHVEPPQLWQLRSRLPRRSDLHGWAMRRHPHRRRAHDPDDHRVPAGRGGRPGMWVFHSGIGQDPEPLHVDRPVGSAHAGHSAALAKTFPPLSCPAPVPAAAPTGPGARQLGTSLSAPRTPSASHSPHPQTSGHAARAPPGVRANHPQERAGRGLPLAVPPVPSRDRRSRPRTATPAAAGAGSSRPPRGDAVHRSGHHGQSSAAFGRRSDEARLATTLSTSHTAPPDPLCTAWPRRRACPQLESQGEDELPHPDRRRDVVDEPNSGLGHAPAQARGSIRAAPKTVSYAPGRTVIANWPQNAAQKSGDRERNG